MKRRNTFFYLNEKNKYSTGIYMIYHISFPEKCYIGSASSAKKHGGYYYRFRSHYSCLLKNNHCNNNLQELCNTFGIEGFRFLPIEDCSPEKCIEREQNYIDMIQPTLNICKIAGNTLGYKHKKEYLDKVRKNIVQYDLDGNFVKIYNGISNTAKKENFSCAGIINCCYNRIKQSSNYMWRFLENSLDKNGNVIKKIPPYINPFHVKIVAYNLDGSLYKIYDSITLAVEDLSLDNGGISRCLQGETRCCGLYMFKYYTENYPLKIDSYLRYHANQLKVTIIDTKTKEAEVYGSFRKAAESNKISRSTLMSKYKQGIKEFHHPYKSKKYHIHIMEYD